MRLLADVVRQKFAIAIRWGLSNKQHPDIVCVCKTCAALWILHDVYDLQRVVEQHIGTFPCQYRIVGNEFSAELEKVLKALEEAE